MLPINKHTKLPMQIIHYISNDVLSIEKLDVILKEDIRLKLSEEAILNIEKCHLYLQNKIKNKTLPKGVIDEECWSDDGNLHPKRVAEKQNDLIKSYACNIGDTVPDNVVKLMLFLKIQSLSYGFSGVNLQTVERLIDFYNNGVMPVVYLNSSPDDRIALANLVQPLIGEGEVRIKGKVYAGIELEELLGWKPLILGVKEAESLLTGTQLTTAYGVHCLSKSSKLSYISDFVASESVSVFGADFSSFSVEVQAVRPHKGQMKTAEQLRMFLMENTENIRGLRRNIPEAFGAVPQVHGAVKDTIYHVQKIIRTEINSTTDNVLIFRDKDQIIVGGNSHTLPLSFGLDYLSIALTGLGNISERRTFHLISNSLSDIKHKHDTHLDLWVLQRLTEGISSQNRRLAVPASVENPLLIEKRAETKGMGASAAIKCFEIVENIERMLALEFLTAILLTKETPAQNNPDFKKRLIETYRKELSEIDSDFSIKQYVALTLQFFATNDFIYISENQ